MNTQQNGWEADAFALSGGAEGMGLVQLEEERNASSGLPTPTRRLAGRRSQIPHEVHVRRMQGNSYILEREDSGC